MNISPISRISAQNVKRNESVKHNNNVLRNENVKRETSLPKAMEQKQELSNPTFKSCGATQAAILTGCSTFGIT